MAFRLVLQSTGGDPVQEGAAIRVIDTEAVKVELESHGVYVANARVDQCDGKKFNVFFVVAPDGLCLYFHGPIGGESLHNRIALVKNNPVTTQTLWGQC